MERLTKRNECTGVGYVPAHWKEQAAADEKALTRLADIEDILGDNYDLDRIRELAQADRDGRCAMVEITYILSNTTFLPEGFCCMSFKPCGIRSRARDFRFAENPWTIPVYGNERNKENG